MEIRCPDCGNVMECEEVKVSCSKCGLIKTYKKEDLVSVARQEIAKIREQACSFK